MNSSNLKEIFDCTIAPEVNEILDNNYGLFFVNNAFDLFYNEYITLHDYYSKKYMNKNSDGLDTHKEIATIVIALLKAKLIKTLNSDYYGSECNRYSFNEQLAFKVSCDLLKSILVCDYKKMKILMQMKKSIVLIHLIAMVFYFLKYHINHTMRTRLQNFIIHL